jgi:hypothetical protein
MRRSFATRCTCKLVLSLVTTKARGSGSFYHCYRIRGHQRLPMPIHSRQESRFIQRLRGCILRSCAAGFDHVAVTSVASLETYHQLLMTQSHLGISPGSLRMSDGCGKLHDAARTCPSGRLLRQYLSSRRLKPTSAPLNFSPIDNGTSKFLLRSKVFVHSRSLITYGTHHSTKAGFIAFVHVLSNHVPRILALLSASRARRLHTRVFIKGSPIRSLSNKRTLVCCEQLVVDRVGLVVSEEVLRWKHKRRSHLNSRSQLTKYQKMTPTNNCNEIRQ